MSASFSSTFLSLWLMIDFISAALPNIVIILADDLGWNDVGFHGSNQVPTPNIDALAYSGVILQDYYTQPICTPARAALLTARHPIHNGMQSDVIYAAEPWGLPLTDRILPEYLEPLGYVSRAVGKWHLGFFKADYTPTRRGFHSHYGSWLGNQNHFTHYANETYAGYDFRRGLDVAWEAEGKYTCDLFSEEAEAVINNHNTSQPLFLYVSHTVPHAPLLAPQPLINTFKYIPLQKRRIFAAMVTKLDESVGRVTQALKDKNMLNNSIILFLSDNGGATHGFNGNVASNWPLRGCKDTLWEGGVRGVGLVWSPLLTAAPRVHRGLINVQDWLPTLLAAVGAGDTHQYDDDLVNIDGVSQWEALLGQSAPPYQVMLHNMDRRRKIGSLRFENWKIVTGRTYDGYYDGFYGKLNGEVPYSVELIRESAAGRAVQTTASPLPEPSTILTLRAEATVSCQPLTQPPHVIQVRDVTNLTNSVSSVRVEDPTDCKPHIAPCLFNIEEDPCETHNVADSNPEIVAQLMAKLNSYHLHKPNNKPGDPRSYPFHWNNTWVNWQDYVNVTNK